MSAYIFIMSARHEEEEKHLNFKYQILVSQIASLQNYSIWIKTDLKF